MRAWIETIVSKLGGNKTFVALRVRAWIETLRTPRRSCRRFVALRVRAWIETGVLKYFIECSSRRPPREGVD